MGFVGVAASPLALNLFVQAANALANCNEKQNSGGSANARLDMLARADGPGGGGGW